MRAPTTPATMGGAAATPFRRATLFVVLLAVLATGIDAGFGVAARTNPVVKVNWIFALHRADLDYVVLGSSRAYHTVDIPAVDRAVSGNGVNLGLNGAAFPELALVLQRFLEHNQTKEIAFEVDPFGLDRNYLHDRLHAYLYVPYIDEPIVADALEDYFGARAIAWRWIPLFKYAEWNERIGLRSVLERIAHPAPEFDAWGSRLSTSRMSDSVVRAIRDTVYQIDRSRVLGLERVLDIAKLHGVRVTMFVAPQFGPAARGVRNREQVIDLYRAVARQRGIVFLTFDDPDIAEDPVNFSDPEHLNKTGARKFSVRLGAALAEAWRVKPAAR